MTVLGRGHRWLAALLAATAVVVGSGTPASAQDVTAVDSANDVRSGTSGAPMSECRADIREYGARYTYPTVSLFVTNACGTNPFTSPMWSTWWTGLTWSLDTGPGVSVDHSVYLNRKSGSLGVTVHLASGDLVCTGTPSWDGARTITATFDSACIGNPETFLLKAYEHLDNSPGTGSTLMPNDEAPDHYNDFLAVQRTMPPLPVGSGPGAASAQVGDVDVFVRGQDDGLHTRHNENGTWQGWQGLGGVITSTPAAASATAGQVDVFVRGQDNALHTRHFDGTTWRGWQGLGGVLTTAPAVVSSTPGTLDLFVAGADRALYARHFNGTGWSGWHDLGGIITATPAAASASDGQITVFGRGQDGALWMQTFNGSAWSGWSSLGGIITTAPGATSRADGTVEVFARGNDNALWAQTFDGGWSGWRSLGGLILSPPAPVSAAPGQLEVFARGMDAALWANRDTGGGFAGWYSLGGVVR